MSLISYVMVVYGFVSDCLIFKETFTWLELLCAALIVLVMIYTAVVKLQESNQAKKQSEEDGFTNADELNRSSTKTQ